MLTADESHSDIRDNRNDTLDGGYGNGSLKGNHGDDLLFGNNSSKDGSGVRDTLDGGPAADAVSIGDLDVRRSVEVVYKR